MDKYIKVDPQKLNLLARLHEMPTAAFARLSASALGLNTRRYKSILYGQIKGISEAEIKAFVKFLKCSQSEFLDPKHIFADFRDPLQIEEDRAETPLEKIA